MPALLGSSCRCSPAPSHRHPGFPQKNPRHSERTPRSEYRRPLPRLMRNEPLFQIHHHRQNAKLQLSPRMKRPTLLLATCLLIHACSTPPRPAGNVIFVIESNPANLDPRYATDGTTQRIDRLLFNGLVVRDNQMKLHGDLAELLGNSRPSHLHISPQTRHSFSRRAPAHLPRRQIHHRIYDGSRQSLPQTRLLQHDFLH